MDSNLIRHKNCDECGSSDAFAEYDDGHGYCYSCGHYQPSQESLNTERMAARLPQATSTASTLATVSLPMEATDELPPKVVQWLMGYGITPSEVKDNHFLWNPKREDLIYPIFDDKYQLLLYQERHFGSYGKRFKTHGKRDSVYKFYGNQGSQVVIVEDVISAIKVGRQMCCLPLLGSNLSTNRIVNLATKFDRLHIWLDWDKLSEAIKARQEALSYFNNGVSVISSQKDPKDYSDKAITTWLNG